MTQGAPRLRGAFFAYTDPLLLWDEIKKTRAFFGARLNIVVD